MSPATSISYLRTHRLMRISPLIVGMIFLAGCESSAGAASRSSSTSVAPTSSVPTSSTSSSSTSTSSSSTTSTAAAAITGVRLSSISSVSCADSMHCWAGAVVAKASNEGAILASGDGGTTWTLQDTVHGVDDMGPIDCPSDTHCFAAGDRVFSHEPPLLLSTTDGGKTWKTQVMASDVAELDAISCSSNNLDCWLVGAQLETEGDLITATTNWGKSWKVQDRSSMEVSMGVTFGIACTSDADCVIVGYGGLTTSDGGSLWVKHSLPGGELNAVSCASENQCVAEGEVTSAIPSNTSTDIATSNDGGAIWKSRVSKVGGGVGDLGSLSCPTTTTCVSVGSGYTSASNGQYSYWGAVERTSDGGQTWTTVKEPQASSLNGVSCAAGTADCIAVGEVNTSAGVILKTIDDGSTWTEIPLPPL
jgi:photosystem II stability/assembly factor-like uncharacterized protein